MRQEKGGAAVQSGAAELLIETKEMKRWIYEQYVVIPVLISFAVSLVLGRWSYRFAETENEADRACGRGSVSSEESGDSYDGGIIILAAIIVTSLFYVKDYPEIIPVLFLTVCVRPDRFLDDYLKVVLKRSDGLLPMQKMALQIVVTAVFAFYIVKWHISR